MKRIERFKMLRSMSKHCDKFTENEWVTITKIVVPTQYDKKQLLLASRYIHNLRNIDTDIHAVNLIAHLYQHPEWIEVSNEH
jgi:hypothetical protein